MNLNPGPNLERNPKPWTLNPKGEDPADLPQGLDFEGQPSEPGATGLGFRV